MVLVSTVVRRKQSSHLIGAVDVALIPIKLPVELFIVSLSLSTQPPSCPNWIKKSYKYALSSVKVTDKKKLTEHFVGKGTWNIFALFTELWTARRLNFPTVTGFILEIGQWASNGPPSVISGGPFSRKGIRERGPPKGILPGSDSPDALPPFWNILGNWKSLGSNYWRIPDVCLVK